MPLNKEQFERISRDLKADPRLSGFTQAQWTGNCLSRHLARQYNLHISARQCRRLIARARQPATSVSLPAPKEVRRELRPWSGFSETFRHEKALQRIRQIASAKLPPKAFASSLIEQLSLATNSGEAAQCIMLCDRGEQRMLFADPAVAAWTVSHLAEHVRATSDDPAVSGMLIPWRQLPKVPERLLAPAQFMSPRFHESPAYDELWKRHRIHLGVMSILRRGGELIGYSPVWKSRSEKPFTQSDLDFLRKAQPLITHGMQVCQACMHSPLSEDLTERLDSNVGVITADFTGRVVAMDERARALFFQPALFDCSYLDAFSSTDLRSGLRYVSTVVRDTFTRLGTALDVPAARVWWHRTGCVLLLRAALSHRLSGSPLVTILVEEHELASTRQLRLAVKYGLTPRESEIFHLSQSGSARKEIAVKLNLSDNTVKTYLKQVTNKINDAGGPAQNR